ncbi:Uncharacterised protein [Bacteroides xylanisolvens]|nr:Uncharacterised protein [Bacteroides xylanisolvens]
MFLQEAAADTIHLIDGLYHVYRHTDGAGLIRDGAGDGLTDPPCRIGRKFIAFGVVEFIDSL